MFDEKIVPCLGDIYNVCTSIHLEREQSMWRYCVPRDVALKPAKDVCTQKTLEVPVVCRTGQEGGYGFSGSFSDRFRCVQGVFNAFFDVFRCVFSVLSSLWRGPGPSRTWARWK